MTDNMDIELPPESTSSIEPRDRLLVRLTQFGVPKEYRVMLHSGLVDYIMDKRSCIPELVAAILPIDKEVAEILQVAKLGSKKSAGQTMKYCFRECMVWLQWLMFLGEPAVALKNLSKMSAGRGVCGAVWGNNDIAYRCRTCEHDPTCAICVPCFQNGNHKDHDYSIMYTGGGCCDCGDVTAWKREGFCSKHKGVEQIKPLPEEFARSVGPVLDALLGCWKNKLLSAETISQKNPNTADRASMCKKIANQLTFAVVEMLLEFCKCSESLLSFVSRRVVSLGGLLEILVRSERLLSEGVVKKLHELLLKLLGDPIFKHEFAKEFLRYYPFVVREAMKETVNDMHKKHSLLSIFSVQIFTVPTLTPRLVKEMNLLGLLLGCLKDIFIQCTGEDGHLQGGAIQGSSKARDVPHFADAVIEGLYYEIRGFYTYENRSTNVVVDNDVVVELKTSVKFKTIDPLTPEVPRYYFNFIDFAHVLSLRRGSRVLTDVLGRLKAIQPLEQVLVRGQTLENKREFILENIRGDEMRITLWSDRARDFDDSALKMLKSPIMMAFVGFRVKEYRGQPNLNGTAASLWYINPDIPEVLPYHHHFEKLHVEVYQLPSSSNAVLKLEDQIIENRKTIKEILCMNPYEHKLTKWENLYETGLRVVEDVRFVLSHGAVSKNVTREQRAVLRTWMELLSFLQGMGPLKRETGLHVEEESENINLPFVLCHSIANIHSLLVDGAFSMSEEADDATFLDMHGKDIDEQDSIRHTKIGRLTQESSVCSVTESTSFISSAKVVEVDSDSTYHHLLPSSVTWLTFECLRAIENCLGADDPSGAQISRDTSSISNSNFSAFKKTLSTTRIGKYMLGGCGSTSEDECSSVAYSSCHASVKVNNANVVRDCKTTVPGENDCAGSSVGLMEGSSSSKLHLLRFLSLSDWPDIIYDVSSHDISVHIPLHRLLSMLLQKALRRCYGESVVTYAINASPPTSSSRTNDDFFACLLEGCHPCGFSAFVMEHPLRNRVFCAQVHAGMWRKNGDAAIICCEWYRSVRWSEQGLEFDLFLLQCCAALAPPDLYVSRILERFGLSDYLSLKAEQTTEYEPVLMQEMLMLLIQIVQERRFSGLTFAENLKRELVHKLAIGDATRSQLVKSLPRDLSKIDQLQEVLDTVAVYSNPSGFNQGTYSLRWAYWKELDLYHPRWNSRDLQVAEERYLRYCSASAGITQLPRWTNIYPPLKGVARIASSRVVIKIIRAVFFYAIFTHKRAPDSVLLSALHLLSLALDIYTQQKEMDMSFYIENSASMFAFAGEEILEGLNDGSGDQSLLSLLVLLMRIHKRESSDNLLEAGSCNISSLIESLLKRFAEIDAGCMTKLQQLAPEIHLSQSVPNFERNTLGSPSDSEKHKAKARERQAAILAKMKAEQSKFLSSMNSATDDVSNSGAEVDSDGAQNLEGSMQDVCSLCHDPNSKNPVSFLVLLQKSRLLSFIDRGPPSWDQDQLPNKEQNSVIAKTMTNQCGISSSSGSGMISSTQLTHFVQDVVTQFANYAQPGEVNAIIEFIKARFPLLRSSQVSSASKDGKDRTLNTFEMLEQDMYFSMRKEMHDDMHVSNSGLQTGKFTAAEGGESSSPESVLLAKYIAALSREITEHPSSSESAPNDELQADFSSQSLTYDGFGPADCDGVHLSSCGHAVHQECHDRYLSSLKERYVRRIVFEGGHIVDPDQGEFLCPVCRRLANSVLPSLPRDFQKVWTQPMLSTVSSLHAADPLASSSGCDSLQLQHALFLLKSAAKMVAKGDILKAIPLQRSEKMWPDLDSISRFLIKLYFPNRWDKFSGSARVNHSMIMWDTLKYSLVSMEIAARCGRTHMTPTYSLNALYKELKSSSGFTLSLLLKIVQNLRSKNSLHVLQRFRGIQLFAQSVCSGVPNNYPSGTYRCGENMSSILAHIGKEVSYPDIQFWNWVAEPVLARDAFSSLMWALFCLPHPFLFCQDSLLSLVHVFYGASVAQAIIMFCGKHQREMRESNFDDSLITDISKVFGESEWIKNFFVSNNIDSSSDIINVIRRLSFPYLRRCALLWKLLSTSVSAPFCDRDVLNRSSNVVNYMMDNTSGGQEELNVVQELEKMFKIPPLFFVLKDHNLRSLVTKWLHHFCKQYEVFSSQHVLHVTPAFPFKLMRLPHVYEDLLQRYIKQKCVGCKNVLDDPALCLLCGRVCSPNWKSCCRESGCQTHAMACGAGTGVFLLIRKTTILLQRCARQAPWPSPYLDAFGEEDIDTNRGKPLYLNEERYAALAYMVASHGFDQSSKVLSQTTIGSFF